MVVETAFGVFCHGEFPWLLYAGGPSGPFFSPALRLLGLRALMNVVRQLVFLL